MNKQQTKIKMPLTRAAPLAEKIKTVLAPACVRIEIAGSIRRMQQPIGDIEIVCIPKIAPDLWGDPYGDSKLEILLDYLLAQGRLTPGGKAGAKYKKFSIPQADGIHLDLFITTAPKWGYQFAIRTGSAAFSKQIVTPRRHGGFLPGNIRVSDSQFWEGGQVLDTSEERAVLELCGGWVEPRDRV